MTCTNSNSCTSFWSTKLNAKANNVFLRFFISRRRCSRQLSMTKRPGDPPLILEDNMLRVRALELQIKKGERDAHDTIQAAGFFGGNSSGGLAVWILYVLISECGGGLFARSAIASVGSVSVWGKFVVFLPYVFHSLSLSQGGIDTFLLTSENKRCSQICFFCYSFMLCAVAYAGHGRNDTAVGHVINTTSHCGDADHECHFQDQLWMVYNIVAIVPGVRIGIAAGKRIVYLRGACYTKKDAGHAYDTLVSIWNWQAVALLIWGVGFFALLGLVGKPGRGIPGKRDKILAAVEAILFAAAAFEASMISVTIKKKNHVTAQRWLSPHFMNFGVCVGVAAILDPVNDTFVRILLGLWSVACFGVGIYLWVKLSQNLERAMAIVTKDMDMYDNVWSGVVDANSEELLLLEKRVTEAKAAMGSWLTDPFNILKGADDDDDCLLINFADEEAGAGVGPRSKISRTVTLEVRAAAKKAGNVNRPVHLVGDLPVLFAQASTLNPHFQGYVREWAVGLEATPHTCGVKRWKRAIEKLFRSYQGDASKLIDLVRGSVGFETVDELALYFGRIVADRRVVVLSIKNRFASDYDSRLSAGYRNLALTLVIVDDFTLENQVEGHVCELQLGLSAHQKLKNDEGHVRYVSWRDARGV